MGAAVAEPGEAGGACRRIAALGRFQSRSVKLRPALAFMVKSQAAADTKPSALELTSGRAEGAAAAVVCIGRRRHLECQTAVYSAALEKQPSRQPCSGACSHNIAARPTIRSIAHLGLGGLGDGGLRCNSRGAGRGQRRVTDACEERGVERQHAWRKHS